ncbi:MAG: type II toxin-antitoxin system VapC family toxin [Gammaproteobacteria bacterium]
MIVFVDTSAFYAVIDGDDRNHRRADEIWKTLLREGSALLTNNYVLLETSALLQHRIGLAALRAFHEDVLPLLTIDWVSPERHKAAVEAVLTANRKKLSIVDCTSFQTMRERAVRAAFCFDDDFKQQGFEPIV